MTGIVFAPRRPRRSLGWCLALSIVSTLLSATDAAGQDTGAEEFDEQPEVIWHETSALFPIRLYLPKNLDSTRAAPVVVALHGFGGSAERFGRIGRAFSDAGYIVAIPEGPYRVSSDESGRHSTWELSTWTEELGLGPPLTEDPAVEARSIELTVDEFLPSVFARVREQYQVERIYLFGFSLGGVYALVGGFYNHNLIDGVIAFGAQFYEELYTARGGQLEDANHLAIRLALGRSDPLVPFSHAERARDAYSEAGYRVVLDAFEGGHTVPDDALRRSVEWLNELESRSQGMGERRGPLSNKRLLLARSRLVVRATR